MNSIDKRLMALESRTLSADSPFVIVVGEPTARDIERMEAATVAVLIPTNGRDDECGNRTTD